LREAVVVVVAEEDGMVAVGGSVGRSERRWRPTELLAGVD